MVTLYVIRRYPHKFASTRLVNTVCLNKAKWVIKFGNRIKQVTSQWRKHVSSSLPSRRVHEEQRQSVRNPRLRGHQAIWTLSTAHQGPPKRKHFQNHIMDLFSKPLAMSTFLIKHSLKWLLKTFLSQGIYLYLPTIPFERTQRTNKRTT